ncbi:MBL fold metallo-hydrolase [Streptomyces sp. NA04227]|uniref:MBL fold metallo-hydrolase n=1 Tax=Streptomyces sp. NA04227 TaxID=2742136 RepID=UPI0015904164|nr:MBL fold metallo-hydrolase [Streptomyces sp. NA04227]QKW06561.1 MBL fold metallo-hydrolase [Streptomyces sp. NA04227]
MTSAPHRHDLTGRLSRRRLARLAVLGLAAGTGSLGLASSATATGRHGLDSGGGKRPGEGQVHYDRARALAGDDPVLSTLAASLMPDFEFPRPPAPEPLKLFDNLAFLSTGWVSAMAVLTDDGIILIDALTSAAEAETVLVPGLRALGADPQAIKYVVATHGHHDHFGGAKYLSDHFGTRVLMTPTDWDLVERTGPADSPSRDLEIADGQRLTLGGTTIRLHRTPGHTSGTVSPIIPVRANGACHTAMLWGGTNPPETLPELHTYRRSVRSFRARMRQADVDVELSNHPNDYGLQRVEQLRERPEGPNPFVLGRARTQRYMQVLDLMLQGRIADAEAAGARGASSTRGSAASRGAAVHGCC